MADYVIENRFPREDEMDELIAYLNRIWHETNFEDGFADFNKDVYKWYTMSPKIDPKYFWLCFHKETRKIIGFGMVVARPIMIAGKGPYTTVIGGLISVDKQYQGLGIGKDLGNVMAKVTEGTDYIGWFIVIEPGSRGLATVRKTEYNSRIQLWDHSLMYIRPLNIRRNASKINMKWYEKFGAMLIEGVKRVDDPRIVPVNVDQDVDQILTLLNSYSTVLRIARVWDRSELLEYLKSPLYRGWVLKENGLIKGLVGAIVVPFFMKNKKFLMAMLENCHYRDISKKDQKLLVRAMLHSLRKEDVTLATEIGSGYHDFSPLRANRFIAYKRHWVLYFLPVIKPDDELLTLIKENKDAIYIDMR